MEENVKSGIAVKLRALRAKNGMTQSDVASALGISQQTYSKYEKQDVNIDSATIVKICEYYGISSDYLLGIKDNSDIDIIVNKVLSKINDEKVKGE